MHRTYSYTRHIIVCSIQIKNDYGHTDIRTLEESRREDIRLEQMFKQLQDLRTDNETLIIEINEFKTRLSTDICRT